MGDMLRLRAGPLSMDFDVQNAFLRYVRFDQFELLRGIFAAVRDRDWNTIPTTVQNFQIEQQEASFELTFMALCRQGEVDFEWRGHLSGTEEGVLRFNFSGEAVSTFFRNRIGLCVLHPSRDCAGQWCRVEHCDGTTTNGAFPQQISPDQPFKNIQAITHSVTADIRARVEFTGDVFEMEDQRNWTDASFKTYSTPLELPFPVETTAGSRILQTVTVKLRANAPDRHSRIVNSAPSPIDVRVAWDDVIVPTPVGFSMSTFGQDPNDAAIENIRALRPRHLRVDLRLHDQAWIAAASDAIALASHAGCQLEVAIHVGESGDSSWKRCFEWLRSHRDLVARVMIFDVFHKSTRFVLTRAALESVQVSKGSPPVVVGTDAYFAELNRNRPAVIDSMQVCYSINPQVHAFDNLSLCETLEAQCETVDSAFAIFGCPVVISPVTLRPRFNPNATSVAVGQSEPETDPRQQTGFAAAWTTGVLGQLATHPRVASLTFYESWGPRGVMDESGNAYPMSQVFAEYSRAQTIFKAVSSEPLNVSAIGLKTVDGQRRVLIGNMSTRPLTVSVEACERHEIPAESVTLLEFPLTTCENAACQKVVSISIARSV